MRKQYDDFTQLKIKDMSKAISDMTYKYINEESNLPTVVPSSHYEKILGQVQENYLGEITSRQFLVIMYNQLSALKKEDEKYFHQALLCLDMGLNPKDLRLDEQIAVNYTYDYISQVQKIEKKNYHFLSNEIVEAYNHYKNDPEIQSEAIRNSNQIEEQESNFGIEDKNKFDMFKEKDNRSDDIFDRY